MNDERRRFPRVNMFGVVDYVGTEGVRCTGIKNISLGGVRLQISAAERPGTRVKLSLTVADDETPIHLLGQVVWARQAEPYEVGISFLDMDPERPPQRLQRCLTG